MLFPPPLLLLLLPPAAAFLPLPLLRSARRRLQIASYDSPASRRALFGSGDWVNTVIQQRTEHFMILRERV